MTDPKELVLKLVPKVQGEQVRANHCKAGADNRAFYVKRDGPFALYHCFHCGISGRVRIDPEAALIIKPRDSPSEPDLVRLPSDCTSMVRQWHPSASIWVLGFGLSEADIVQHGIAYSKAREALIFPMMRRDNVLIGYQYRKFPPAKKGPKYVTIIGKNSKNNLKIMQSSAPNKERVLIITEDYLSAAKCTGLADSFCCFGTQIPINPKDLVQYDRVFLWFDHDNRQVIKRELEGLAYIRQFVPFARIVKKGDPKRMTIEQIKGELCR